ncbi:TPA: glycosyltransferase [Yersinia enterocolitica]|uniref:GlcNAc-transferase family protein n=1 Tax=Yersinia enterocolitica TaxID=630 RepID=UPI00155B00EE|nr:GlcNAc-transferase family protein [Yersinia enterocolitica]EKN3724834.1 glycosyltransferase [Yersinia enterocolitica]EKN4810358.1 glycosyltransferase [Yersinia enterocolitica]EKN6260675.1 glycosyltransferase [Yersinia enterocolitica]ELI8044074.1 glycosyltransferase [Yersinia enterocolitica]ELI8441469.1 glycosyltransferase [Yersinia enterocolitica]
MQSVSSIFVSIASYRDSELIPTLHDMINTAKSPENLNIAVFWQDENDINTFINQGMRLIESQTHLGYPLHQLEYNQAHIWVLAVHYYESKGACWARHMAEGLFQDETYFLQIDSHCRFIQHWDHEMVTMLNSLRDKSPKPILSAYPPGYEPGENENRKDYVSRLIFNTFTPEGMVQMMSTPFTENAPVRCGYLAAGFIFTDGCFVREVANDPDIFFLGEEIAMAARAFTHGYDCYAPHKILLWHFYTRSKHSKVWSDHNNEAKKSGAVELAWWERDKIAKSRVRTLLGTEQSNAELGCYALGSQRSLQEFEYRLGVNFSKRAVHPDVVGTHKVSYFTDLPAAHEQWLESLILVNKKTLKIEKHEADFTREDVEWWHIGVYNAQNAQVMAEHVDISNMKKIITKTDDSIFELKLAFNTETDSNPRSVRICPYIRLQGWGDVVEKPW